MDSETNQGIEQIAQSDNSAAVDQQPRTPTSDRRSFLRTAAAGVTAAGILAATGKPESAYAQAVNPRSPTPDPTAVAAEIKKIQAEAEARRAANSPPAPPVVPPPTVRETPPPEPVSGTGTAIRVGGAIAGSALAVEELYSHGKLMRKIGKGLKNWFSDEKVMNQPRPPIPEPALPVTPVPGVAQAPAGAAPEAAQAVHPAAAPAQPEQQPAAPVPAAAANIEPVDVVAWLNDFQGAAAAEPQPAPAAPTPSVVPPPQVSPTPPAPPAAPAQGETSQRP